MSTSTTDGGRSRWPSHWPSSSSPSEIERFVAEMSVIQDAVAELGGTIIDAWLAIIVQVFAVLVTVFAVLAAARARAVRDLR